MYVTNTPSVGFFRNYLYMGLAIRTFSEEAPARGVEGEDPGAHGAVFADFNNDGEFDLVVGNAMGQDRIYRNDAGFFTDMTAGSGLDGTDFETRGVAVGDFTGDGLYDFIMTNPVFDLDPRFFNNLGDFDFLAEDAGLDYTGFTQGVTVGDVDNDGDLDLIESLWGSLNAGGRTNRLWLNDGLGYFFDGSDAVGFTFSHDSARAYNGSVLGDTDNDGDLDLLVIGEVLRFFRNEGGGAFLEITDLTGLEGAAFGAAMGDLDNDGDLDVVVADSDGPYSVWDNIGDNSFVRRSTLTPPPGGNVDPRGVALADYDNDGDLDIAIAHKLATTQLWRNEAGASNYLKLRLANAEGQAGPIGTKVYVYIAGQLDQASALLAYREIGSATGYVTQDSPVVHVGLGTRTSVDIRVSFPDGLSQTRTSVSGLVVINAWEIPNTPSGSWRIRGLLLLLQGLF